MAPPARAAFFLRRGARVQQIARAGGLYQVKGTERNNDLSTP